MLCMSIMQYAQRFGVYRCAYCTLEICVCLWYNRSENKCKRGDDMPIAYKIDVLQKKKKKGFSTYKLRREKIFGEATIQAFRKGTLVSYDNLAKLCRLLECQPGDIMEYIEEGGEEDV